MHKTRLRRHTGNGQRVYSVICRLVLPALPAVSGVEGS